MLVLEQVEVLSTAKNLVTRFQDLECKNENLVEIPIFITLSKECDLWTISQEVILFRFRNQHSIYK